MSIRIGTSLLLTGVMSIALLSGVARRDVRASGQDTVSLARGSVVSLATPAFIEAKKRYTFTWPGGGPPQTFIALLHRILGQHFDTAAVANEVFALVVCMKTE